MAENSLFPGFIKLSYTSNAHPHTMTIPCKPFVNVAGGINLEQKGVGAGVAWDVGLTEYVNALRFLLHTSGVFVSADVYTMSSPDADPLYRDTAALGIVGTGATTTFPFSQAVITFRTNAGGTYRMQLMEISAALVNQEINPPFAGATLALSNYLTGLTSIVFGRDGGALVAPTRYLTKTNDALRKKYLLDG